MQDKWRHNPDDENLNELHCSNSEIFFTRLLTKTSVSGLIALFIQSAPPHILSFYPEINTIVSTLAK
jgi:hypothetical protein